MADLGELSPVQIGEAAYLFGAIRIRQLRLKSELSPVPASEASGEQ